MRVCKPATPGFLFNLSATALLAVVSFSVPYFKSIYFLKAAITQSGVGGSVTFGVLGYCLDFSNQITCSKPSVGWEFDPNQLLGNDLPIQIPNVVVKWLTYALVLHIVALGLAGVSTVFSLLAHVREITMTCFSSCISGMAAAVALIAFIFDLVVFFVVRARVNSIQGGSASIGNGLWMTLAAWALLFFSGCVAIFGRCCVSGKSSSGRRKKDREHDTEDSGSTKYDRESERMRLDAVKAEADRKRQQAEQREGGLPAFYEYERTPLKRDEPQYYEEEVEVIAPYSDRPRRDGSTRTAGGAGGARAYQPAAPGTRTVDDYYNNSAPAANTYPPQPQPQRQPSQTSQRTYQTATATPPTRFQSPPVPPMPSNFVDPYSSRAVDPYLAVATAGAGAGAYGHQAESSYSNLSAHQQYPSGQQYPSQGHQQYTSAGHQQYPSSGHQYSSPPPQQDPYALSSYNPGVATMSPPQPTHYQDHSQGYDQQAYDQQRGYDAQQEYNHAAQQMYAQPEPQHANPAGYDPYGQAQRQPSYDQYNNQGYDPYGQQPYVQEPYAQEPYAQPQPTRQQTYDQSRSLVASPSPLVASPSPITSPPEVNTAVPAQAGPSSNTWSQESPAEAPPPQYEPMAGAAGAAAAASTTYPREKR